MTSRLSGRRRVAGLLAAVCLLLTACQPPGAAGGNRGAAGDTTGSGSATTGSSSSAASPRTSPGTSSAGGQSPRTSPGMPSSKPSSAPTTSSPSASGGSTSTSTSTHTSKASPATLHLGDQGGAVTQLQHRLRDLGYWLGSPDGEYGDLTRQAVVALQKAAGIARDGVFGPASRRPLDAGTRPKARTSSGSAVEINLKRQLMLVVLDGQVAYVFNTSTGTGRAYASQGVQHVAVTPTGRYQFFRAVDGEDRSPLGVLWRPRYFNGGIAVHGFGSVPSYPASHGCARLSIPAMDLIWTKGLMPMGRTVWVY